MAEKYDNEFTRKEEICPLANDYCNREEKDCGICILEQEEWEKQQEYEYSMERMMWEERIRELDRES